MSYAIIGQRCKGAAHKRINKECQDFLDKREFKDDGTVALAVADGHGSSTSPYSAIGSQLAVEAFNKVIGDLYEAYRNSSYQLMTLLNREGDTRIAQEICKTWQEKVIKRHRQNNHMIPVLPDGTPNEEATYRMYGTTLLGLLITKEFIFAFQIGDGDIAFVDKNGFTRVVEPDKILGVETHSLSKPDAWEKAVTSVRQWNIGTELPSAFFMTTDGFSNSFKSDNGYERTCIEYYDTLNEYGPEAVKNNLRKWLTETSEGGCGDDISMMILYNYHDDAIFKPVPKEEKSK